MSIEASYILELIKGCNSEAVTCDDCKWDNLGRCKSEEAYKIVSNMTHEEKLKYPQNVRQKLYNILLFSKEDINKFKKEEFNHA